MPYHIGLFKAPRDDRTNLYPVFLLDVFVADVVAVVAPHARRQHDAPGPLRGAKASVSLEHWQELANQVSCG